MKAVAMVAAALGLAVGGLYGAYANDLARHSQVVQAKVVQVAKKCGPSSVVILCKR